MRMLRRESAGHTLELPSGLRVSRAEDRSEVAAREIAQRVVDGQSVPRPSVPPASSQRLPGGAPLDAPLRDEFEARFGVPLDGVRVHDDPAAHDAAASLGASAFTLGRDVVLGAGRPAPDTHAGKSLMAHELAHVVLGGDGVLHRREEEGDEEREDSPRTLPARPAIEEEDPLARPERRSYQPRVDDREPELVLVPVDATRAEIAARILGDESLAEELDLVPTTTARESEQGVRARVWSHLVPEVRERLTAALDRQLGEDVAWTIERLKESGLDDEEKWAVTERTLRWSQRSEIQTANGDTYFDAFLDRLAAVRLEQPHWYTLTLTSSSRTGLEWLVRETGDRAEQIHKMIALRSHRYVTTYEVTDSRPGLSPGDVAGRFYWGSGSGAGGGLQLTVARTLVVESSLERAETAVRSSPYQGIRIVVPGTDGQFHGYAIVSPTLDLMIRAPEEGAEGQYYWYHPGTVMVRAGEFRADFHAGDGPRREQRREILVTAMSGGEASAVLGLDFDVLSSASIEERVRLTQRALEPMLEQDRSTLSRMAAVLGSGQSPQVAFLMRLILSTPDSDFPAYERALASSGLLGNLLSMWDRPALVLVGRAFTAKTLASIPVGVEAFTGMETLRVGKDERGVQHFGYGSAAPVESKTLARANWPASAAPRVGREPAMAGEAAGAITRQAIVFHLGTSGPTSPEMEFGRTTRAFLPTELVRIEVLGDHPQSVVVSALEAASLLGRASISTAMGGFGKLINVNLWAMTATGLARAFGPAVTRALAAESVGEGLAILGAAAGTTAGRQALMGALLLGSMNVVDAYRDELNQTEAGRAFLTIYDIGMAIVISHDVYRLMSSGILDELLSAGRLAVRAITGAARRSLAELTQLFEALELTARRALSEGALVEAIGPDGVRSLMPANELRLSQLFMMSRAEVAGRAVMTALTEAGASTATAERVLQRLEALAGRSDELKAAWSAVARRASSFGAGEIDAYLEAVERVLATRPGAAADLAGFLRASARAANPLPFLEEVQALASRDVGNEALRVLGEKALAGRVDLPWLNRLVISDADLAFLGADARTPWDGIRRAVGGDNEGFRTMMRARLRGAAAELAAEETIGEIVPGYRIAHRQVRFPEGTVIDFELVATDGTGRTLGLEVKGYRGETWRNALNAWALREAGESLSEEQGRLVRMLDDDIVQFTAQQAAYPRGPLKIGVTRELTGPTLRKLRAFLAEQVRGAELVFLEEDVIASISRRFRVTFGLEVPTP